MTSLTARAVAALAFVALTLGGCSAAPAPQPSASEMSIEEAGEFYLDTVCPTNAVGRDLAQAYSAQDVEAFTAAAAVARDAYKESAARFGSEEVVWPAEIEPDIIILRDASIAIAASYETLSQVTSLDEADQVQFPSSDDSAGAAGRIRDVLGLTSDAAESCG